ncbi:DNA-binding protein [Paraburkholderia sp. ZP32-5]|uniref:DNA-binding protein n=1 Tax=Paraburkholderia sp. ZP32-5 TaxID=2883245 RepID=UPI001F3358A3|nr:DNA-binding protein [Paraburkholderia sp. ZP32-5]
MTLESDIEAAREHASDTQALYREVCALLFFRYGETPTANRLYQLVRKGSMSAPAKALRDFWVEVRDKTRVDVGRPDLPPEVASAAGELVAQLWRLSSDAASAALDTFRQDADAQIAAAREQSRQYDNERQQAVENAEQAANDASALRTRIGVLDARIVELQTANDMLAAQLAASKEEIASASTALADARRDFAEELAKLRRAHEQNEQRLAAAEKRALLEIEAERTAAQRLRKELQASQERAVALEADHRTQNDALRDELASTKAELAASNARDALNSAQLVEKDTLLAERGAAVALLRDRIETMSRQLDTARAARGVARPARLSREKAVPQGRAPGAFSGAGFIRRVSHAKTSESEE